MVQRYMKAEIMLTITPKWPHNSAPCFTEDVTRRWTSQELRHLPQNLLNILHNIHGFCKIADSWISHVTTKVQQWRSYTTAHAESLPERRWQLPWMDPHYEENCAHFYELCSKKKSNEWKNPSTPHPKKVHCGQGGLKVLFIVENDIIGLYCTTWYLNISIISLSWS